MKSRFNCWVVFALSLASINLASAQSRPLGEQNDLQDAGPIRQTRPTPKRDFGGYEKDTGFRLGIGPTLWTNGATLFGGNLLLMAQMSDEFSLGIDTGAVFFSASVTGASIGTYSGSVTIIPVMPTFSYRFTIQDSIARPYIGMSAGIAIVSASVTSVGSGSGVVFSGAFRLGMELAMSKAAAFYIEPKFGLLSSVFVFEPTVGVIFTM